jgi:hypothetical protein
MLSVAEPQGEYVRGINRRQDFLDESRPIRQREPPQDVTFDDARFSWRCRLEGAVQPFRFVRNKLNDSHNILFLPPIESWCDRVPSWQARIDCPGDIEISSSFYIINYIVEK